MEEWIDVSEGELWLRERMDGCVGRCVLVGCIYVWMCR